MRFESLRFIGSKEFWYRGISSVLIFGAISLLLQSSSERQQRQSNDATDVQGVAQTLQPEDPVVGIPDYYTVPDEFVTAAVVTGTVPLLNAMSPWVLDSMGLSNDWADYVPSVMDTTGITDTIPVIAVLDGGLNQDDPHFADRLVTPQEAGCQGNVADFVDLDTDPGFDGRNLHGYGVTSQILRFPYSKILTVRVLNPFNNTNFDKVADALEYVQTCEKVQIINLSLGCFCGNNYEHDRLHTVMRELTDAGVLIVVAANNAANNAASTPAYWEESLEVGGSTKSGNFWSGSNRYFTIDTAAPSESILGFTDNYTNTRTLEWSGTSLGAPIISGLAGTIVAQHNIAPTLAGELIDLNGLNFSEPGPTYIDRFYYNRSTGLIGPDGATYDILSNPTILYLPFVAR